jgi:hypothetical protein
VVREHTRIIDSGPGTPNHPHTLPSPRQAHIPQVQHEESKDTPVSTAEPAAARAASSDPESDVLVDTSAGNAASWQRSIEDVPCHSSRDPAPEIPTDVVMTDLHSSQETDPATPEDPILPHASRGGSTARTPPSAPAELKDLVGVGGTTTAVQGMLQCHRRRSIDSREGPASRDDAPLPKRPRLDTTAVHEIITIESDEDEEEEEADDDSSSENADLTSSNPSSIDAPIDAMSEDERLNLYAPSSFL